MIILECMHIWYSRGIEDMSSTMCILSLSNLFHVSEQIYM